MRRLTVQTRRYSLAVLALLLILAGLSTDGRRARPSEAVLQLTATPSPAPTDIPTLTPTSTQTPTLPAPTLVPPTPVDAGVTPSPTAPVTQSGLANAQAEGVLRVGTLYNAYPFAWLDERGQVDGYEADILRAIGIELGVEIEFVQVTRQNAISTLLSGQVDLLIGQQVHSWDRERILEFTHPYFVNEQRMVVIQESAYTELPQLAGLPVSVEIGSHAERALRLWSERTGIQFDIRPYFSESEALDALALGEVQGMVGALDSLRRAGRQHMRLINEVILSEPYAIAVRRWDVNLRNLLNRSLQRLKASGRLDEIFKEWFPGESIDFHTLVPVYDTLYNDARGLAEFNADMPYPANPVMQRIESGQPVRVAGLLSPGEEAPAQVRITDALNRALVEDMIRRWGAQVEFVPNSALNAVDLVANGQADLAVGVTPRWDGADRVDYSLPYIQHSDRLLVPANEPINGFADMLGTGWWIGYFADDALDAENIKKYAEYFRVAQNIREPFAIQREADAIRIMVDEDNISAIYGDSLRLLALIREQNAGERVRLLDTPYGDLMPIAFAVPRNDADFRALVDTTLQQMARDGTYARFWNDLFGLGSPLNIPIWPEQNPDPLP